LTKCETALPGVYELRPKVISDERGYFMETYHRTKFAELGISDSFVQDNHSSSKQGTVRGLHYQLLHPQAKLCRVIEGEAFDVAVDIRRNSPHFGKWVGVRLSAELRNELYIPVGFAHGFLAVTSTVQFLYKCSDYYDSSDEHGISWRDPDLNIAWDVSAPLISGKDSHYRYLADIMPELLPEYTINEN
jgi:dTDP-4-dehydrorhamnose 3,5-epimerase